METETPPTSEPDPTHLPDDYPEPVPLFSDPAASTADELRRMIAWARYLLHTDDEDLDYLVDRLWELPLYAPEPLVERIRAGEAPPLALEVLAGLQGIVSAQDHCIHHIWDAAWALARPEPETGDEPPLTPASVAAIEREIGPVAAEKLRTEREERARARRAHEREVIEAAIAEHAGGDPKLTQIHRNAYLTRDRVGITAGGLVRPGRGAPPEGAADHLAAAFRAAPIGAGGEEQHDAAVARPALWHYRALGLHWEALAAAFDAVCAASHAGRERLHALADAHPDSPSLAWLDEIASRVADEGDRAWDCSFRIDELLGESTYGRNALLLIRSVEPLRTELEDQATALHDAWLRLGASRRVRAGGDPFDDLSPNARVMLRRAARAGDPVALQVWSAAAFSSTLHAEDRDEEEQEGPFHGLAPDLARSKAVDPAVRALVLGFREIYGMELLRDAVPRLELWLGVERPGEGAPG